MALNSVYCAGVPLINCSLTHPLCASLHEFDENWTQNCDNAPKRPRLLVSVSVFTVHLSTTPSLLYRRVVGDTSLRPLSLSLSLSLSADRSFAVVPRPCAAKCISGRSSHCNYVNYELRLLPTARVVSTCQRRMQVDIVRAAN